MHDFTRQSISHTATHDACADHVGHNVCGHLQWKIATHVVPYVVCACVVSRYFCRRVRIHLYKLTIDRLIYEIAKWLQLLAAFYKRSVVDKINPQRPIV